MEIKKIGIVGGGFMGTGICQLSAMKGFDVLVYDIEQRFLDNSKNNIIAQLDKSVAKGKLTEEEKAAILGRIQYTVNLEDFASVDFVIEAVVENLDIKKNVFSQLDKICRPEVILCTNTSSMSITIISTATKRPDRVAGMHFFSPAVVMKLVEVIRGIDTSDETTATVKALAEALGKTAVTVEKDTPGFIVNRVLFPLLLESIEIYEQGIASKEDIDTAVKLGLNHPMGPFELMDYTGFDTLLSSTEYFFAETKNPKWNVPHTARDLIRSGKTGRKAGKGWYDYTK